MFSARRKLVSILAIASMIFTIPLFVGLDTRVLIQKANADVTGVSSASVALEVGESTSVTVEVSNSGQNVTETIASPTAAISNVELTGNLATITTSTTHSFQVGQSVVVAGAADTTFNGSHTITAKTATSITFAKTNADIVSKSEIGTISAATGIISVTTLDRRPSGNQVIFDINATAPGTAEITFDQSGGSNNKVTVTVTQPAANFSSFSITSPSAAGVISGSGASRSIAITVPSGTVLTNLIASFTATDGATVKVETTTQVSGTTENDFSSSVVYEVSKTGLTTVQYTVTVTATANPDPINSSASPISKVTLCHATSAPTNPYRRITVSVNSVFGARGHGSHTGDPFNATPNFYSTNARNWGDVIPAFYYTNSNGDPTLYSGLNWTSTGSAIYNGTGDYFNTCGVDGRTDSPVTRVMTAQEFLELETQPAQPDGSGGGGKSRAAVLADLDEMGANEDRALREAIGPGGFASVDETKSISELITSWTALVSATTENATGIGQYRATLPGTLTVGSTSTKWFFEHGTSATLTGADTTPISGSGVTGSNNAVSHTLTELTETTTYYFRVVGVTNSGTD